MSLKAPSSTLPNSLKDESFVDIAQNKTLLQCWWLFTAFGSAPAGSHRDGRSEQTGLSPAAATVALPADMNWGNMQSVDDETESSFGSRFEFSNILVSSQCHMGM